MSVLSSASASLSARIAYTTKLLSAVRCLKLENTQTRAKELQSEIDRLEDLYCDYCDDYKDDNGIRPNNKHSITEAQIKAYYGRQ